MASDPGGDASGVSPNCAGSFGGELGRRKLFKLIRFEKVKKLLDIVVQGLRIPDDETPIEAEGDGSCHVSDDQFQSSEIPRNF